MNCRGTAQPARVAAELAAMLAAWRLDIDSVPFPEITAGRRQEASRE